MNDSRDQISQLVHSSRCKLYGYVRWSFFCDLLVLIAWLGVFIALTPSGHVPGALLVGVAPVAITMYRLSVFAPKLFLSGAALRELRADKMHNAPTRFRQLAFISHVPYLYTWSMAGYVSVFIGHPLAALFVVIYSGVRAKSENVTWFFLVYALAVTASALATYRSTTRLYDCGIQANIESTLGGESRRRAYATVVATRKVSSALDRAQDELKRERARRKPQTTTNASSLAAPEACALD